MERLKTTSDIEYNNQALMRVLDTNGDGTGTKSAIGDYSVTPQVFFIKPPAGRIYRILKMVVHVGDNGLFSPESYGSVATLTNGLLFDLSDDSGVLVDLLDGIPVKNNGLWSHVSLNTIFTDYGAAADNIQTQIIDFEKSFGYALLLHGDRGEKLQVTMRDNVSGLTHHHFVAHGYWYDI